MTAADSVGSADGTLVGSPEWRSGGANPRGSYLRFGTGTQVDLPPIITVGPGISCSVTAWLRRQSGSVGEEAALRLVSRQGFYDLPRHWRMAGRYLFYRYRKCLLDLAAMCRIRAVRNRAVGITLPLFSGPLRFL